MTRAPSDPRAASSASTTATATGPPTTPRRSARREECTRSVRSSKTRMAPGSTDWTRRLDSTWSQSRRKRSWRPDTLRRRRLAGRVPFAWSVLEKNLDPMVRMTAEATQFMVDRYLHAVRQVREGEARVVRRARWRSRRRVQLLKVTCPNDCSVPRRPAPGGRRTWLCPRTALQKSVSAPTPISKPLGDKGPEPESAAKEDFCSGLLVSPSARVRRIPTHSAMLCAEQ